MPRLVLAWAILVAPPLMAETPSPRAAAPQPRSSDLSGPWQLFVDDCLIETVQGVRRTYHPFEKHPGNPLEGIHKFGGRGTVLPGADGRGYRLWSSGGRGYYVSDDGLSWRRGPKTGRDYPESHGCASVVFAPWERDPARRYFLVSKYYDPAARRDALSKGGGWYGSFSADGIHWTSAAGGPLFSDRGDVGKFCWDPRRRELFGTPKIWSDVRGHLRRCVGTSSGHLDASWPTARLMLVPDQEDDRWATRPEQHTQFYGLSAFAYETVYLGLLEVFRVTDGINDGPIHIELVTSRDRVHWDRTAGGREPILPLGAAGAWDGGMIKVPNHPIVERDVIKLYYGANNRTHGFGRSYHATRDRAAERAGGTGLATLRKDGFASLDAAETGSVTTVPLSGTSGRLALNYRARPRGWVKVEVLDALGQVVEGYGRDDCRPLTGDCVDRPVRWTSHRSLPPAGRGLRLRFWLHQASLFSFRAGNHARAEVERPPLAVLYTFEDPQAADALVEDGGQRLFFRGDVGVAAEPASAGGGCVVFGERDESGNTLEIDDSFRLGRRFTLAALAKPAGEGPMRLFSAWEPFPTRVNEAPYERVGDFGAGELIFDFVAAADGSPRSVRLVVHGGSITAAACPAPGSAYHLAATYDDGMVRLFVNGRQVGQGRVPGGAVTLLTNLRVGEDCGPLSNRAGGATSDEQFRGAIDDILVLARLVDPAQMRALGEVGAQTFFDLKERREK